jgi:hypothetical protein
MIYKVFIKCIFNAFELIYYIDNIELCGNINR